MSEKLSNFWQQEFTSQISGSHFSGRPQWMLDFQKENNVTFKELGLPDKSNEHWKYTSVSNKLDEDFVVAHPMELPEAGNELISDPQRIVFYNGYYCEDKSEVEGKGVIVKSLNLGSLDKTQIENLKSNFILDDSLTSLGLSLSTEVLSISVDNAVALSGPLTLDFIYGKSFNGQANKPLSYHPIILFDVGENSQLFVRERHRDLDNSPKFANVHIFGSLESQARLEWVKLVSQCDATRHISRFELKQAKESFASVSFFSTGGVLYRQATDCYQTEERAETEVQGLYLTQYDEHVDHRVSINHLAPYGVSRQLYKGVLKDKSRSIFNGKIYIAEGAQKVNSNQLNNNLVLSKGAEADSKPELEVYADDVKANHGSAIGKLDEDQLFYLMSRCISKEEAIKILAEGFAGDVVLKVLNKELRDKVLAWIEASFGGFRSSLEEGAQ